MECPDKRRHSGLYGRRKGKKLRPHQADLMVSLLPELQLDLSRKIDNPQTLFGSFTPQEIWLEIGFGGAEHLISEALRHPDKGFIGCEPFVNGIARERLPQLRRTTFRISVFIRVMHANFHRGIAPRDPSAGSICCFQIHGRSGASYASGVSSRTRRLSALERVMCEGA